MEKYVSKKYLSEKLKDLKFSMDTIEFRCGDNDEVDPETLVRVKDDMIYACQGIINELGGPDE